MGNRLIQQLSKICRDHRLAEKWLLVPSRRVGHQWVQQVVLLGQPILNLHLKTVRSLAVEAAAPELLARSWEIASRPSRLLLVDRVLRQCSEEGLAYFGALHRSWRLGEALLDSLESLRLAGVRPQELRDDCFGVASKSRDLRVLAERYENALGDACLADMSQVLQLAIQQFQTQNVSLPDDILVLLPEDLELCRLERDLVAALPAACRVTLEVDLTLQETLSTEVDQLPTALHRFHWQTDTAPSDGRDAKRTSNGDRLERRAALGEVNEVRDIFRRCLAEGVPWDQVEVLYTDRETYVPLLFETLATIRPEISSAMNEMPVTFAEGLPCSLSRPGRALEAWLRWEQSNHPQSGLVDMIKQGLLAEPDEGSESVGFGRLASLLRGLGIGIGLDRYLPAVISGRQAVKTRLARPSADEDDPAEASEERRRTTLAGWDALESLMRRIISCSPGTAPSATEVFAAAERFLEDGVRCANDFDRYAVTKLLEDVREVSRWCRQHHGLSAAEAWEWLGSLPVEARVLGSSPRPGCLHVDSLYAGGHSGRPNMFIVGLDDGRYPGSGLQDPLLLDSERQRLSEHLPTAVGRRDQSFASFCSLLARMRGHVTLSYAVRSLETDGAQFPSSIVQDLARRATPAEKPAAMDPEQTGRLLATFTPDRADEALTIGEWWLYRLSLSNSMQDRRPLVYALYPQLGRGCAAQQAQLSDQLNPFNGLVPVVPHEADQVWSATRLETLGTCPRRYFFKYVLGVTPPDEFAFDPSQWLDALTRGSLLHEVFENFLRPFVGSQQIPSESTDAAALMSILEERIRHYCEQVPPPSETVYHKECRQLREAANTFLREEVRHFRETGNRPLLLEVSLGMDSAEHGTAWDRAEPIELVVDDGLRLRVRGRIDRVESIGGAPDRFGIWDYKSGGTFGYDQSDPLAKGRKIQPYLYVEMLNRRLRELLSDTARTDFFGYFFPGHKTKGQRMQWSIPELAGGRSAVTDLLRIANQGLFVATDDPGDCRFCEYREICRSPQQVTASTKSMLQGPAAEELTPFRQLRQLELLDA